MQRAAKSTAIAEGNAVLGRRLTQTFKNILDDRIINTGYASSNDYRQAEHHVVAKDGN